MLLCLRYQLQHCLLVAGNIQLVSLLEVLEEVLAYGFIKSSATTLTSGAGEHSQLALVEAARRNLSSRMTNVDKDHISCRLVCLWQILLVDSIGQRCGCCVVHQPQNVESRHLG